MRASPAVTYDESFSDVFAASEVFHTALAFHWILRVVQNLAMSEEKSRAAIVHLSDWRFPLVVISLGTNQTCDTDHCRPERRKTRRCMNTCGIETYDFVGQCFEKQNAILFNHCTALAKREREELVDRSPVSQLTAPLNEPSLSHIFSTKNDRISS